MTHSYPGNEASAPILLTDGTVLVHEVCSQIWYKLTPDIDGSYINGSWSQVAQLPNGYAPLYYASQVLPDGRLIINGGEYNNCNSVWTNLGAIYDPLTDQWKPVSPPSGWTTIGDAQSVVLPNGAYMLANCCTKESALLNASSLTWTSTGGGKFDENDEEGWTLLPTGKILTVDAYVNAGTCGRNSELYNASSGAWSTAGNTPTQLPDCSGTAENGGPSYEMGPVVQRPDGAVLAFGATVQTPATTAFFNPYTVFWQVGPNLPTIANQNYNLADAPAAVLPNGNILFAASPGLFGTPTHFFEVNITSNAISQVADTVNAPNDSAYTINLLVLPTGQIMETAFSSSIEVYTPSGTPNSSWRPAITSLPTILTPGQIYQIGGTQLNGLTEGGFYGDDNQDSTNFPLVRITNGSTGHVFFARTSGLSSRTIAPSAAATANFAVPKNIENGPSSLVVVANGIQSNAMAVTVGNNSSASLQVSPSTNIVGSGTQFGPFAPPIFQYQLSASSGSVAYSITNLPSWLSVSAASGTVTTTPVTVTFSYNNNSINLLPGSSVGNVNFNNTTNGQGNTTRGATLTVKSLIVGSGGK